MTRRVFGLKSARRLLERPEGLPIGRPRGKKAYGVRYEKALEKYLAGRSEAWKKGVWWEFWDANGRGICQTDFLAVRPFGAIILEAKYTWTADAWEQLEGLYLPVVRMALRLPASGIQVCRNLLPEADGRVVIGLDMAEDLTGVARRVTWHWMGIG